eukprot:TRINITY_DN5757_c0_g3_i1.p1 TRINITY_DN5757_c0_g3~~TRINITY_DN5757_c0_g3_i1.p1  ORF type:complete len:789 (+),score=233.10 TRINITY_DN5757_c0_g3_i1:42-2408(+)
MRLQFLGALLLGTCCASSAAPSADPTAAVMGLVTRIAPNIASKFSCDLRNASSCSGPTGKCFGYYSNDNGTIVLQGTSGVELAMAFNHYLKYQAGCSVSWWRTGGNQLLNLKSTTPVSGTVHIERAHAEHYYANVVTFSYSFVWYTLEDWIAEIDWMALNGVTLPLAYTGQEKVYQKVYNKLGVTDAQLSDYFAGPAFLAWARGQGLRGWGGPLPQSWIDGQWELQRQILPKMRAFGMRPVLPAFQGNVPVALMELFPKANISRVGECLSPVRNQYACAPWLDALDPLFNTTADLVMQTVIQDFGTDHYYAADGTFSHTSAPWARSDAPLGSSPSGAAVDMGAYNHSTAAFAGMTRTDPDAKWLFQTWSWLYGATEEYMRGWVTAIPTGRLILLDLMAEENAMWPRTESYFGAPYLWCMLHNFGGNDGMWGDLPALSTGPTTSVQPKGANLIGTGLTMEGTNQNAVVYDFMNEMAYRQDPVPDLQGWVTQYAARRYGVDNSNASDAWKVLLETAYNATGYGMMVSKDTLTAVPYGTGWDSLPGSHWYDEKHFLDVWSSLLAAADDPKIKALEAAGVWTFRHDLADVARQAIAKFSSILYTRLNTTVVNKDICGVTMAGEALAQAARDANSIVATVPGFSMGLWVENAKKWGNNDTNTTALMSWNARTQVTFWEYPQPPSSNETGPATVIPTLLDYATKHWGGLLDTYHAPRWQLYSRLVVDALSDGKTLDEETWHVKLIDWYDQWRETNLDFPTEPVGDTVEVARNLYNTYAPQISQMADAWVPPKCS